MSPFEQYRKDGYIVLKNVITQNEIEKIRELSFELLEEKRKEGVISLYTQTFVENEALINTFFEEKVVAAIKTVFGDDFITFNQFSLTANTLSPVWHTDSQSQGKSEYLFHPQYNISKCGLYLQEDDDTYGGGLEIIPRSHLPTFLGYRSPISRNRKYGVMSTIQSKAIKLRNAFLPKVRLKLNAGDVLMFHGLLWHRASQPDWSKVEATERYGIKNPPRDKYKFMIQWEMSPNNEFASIYATHQQLRAKRAGDRKLYEESNNVSYPQDYPQSTIALIEKNQCNVKNYNDLAHDTNNAINTTSDGTPITFSLKNQR